MKKDLRIKEEVQTKVGARIREIRESKKISQMKLAEMCNCERSNMSRLENGNTNATVYTLHIIADALEVPVSEFLK